VATAHVPDNTFPWLMRQGEERMIGLRATACHATTGDPSHVQLGQRGAWQTACGWRRCARCWPWDAMAAGHAPRVDVWPCPARGHHSRLQGVGPLAWLPALRVCLRAPLHGCL